MLNRHDVLLDGITKEMLGIEIGPWHNPLVPKRAGYNSLSLDVFDGPELRTRAKADSGIPDALIDAIEDVDLVGTVSQLGMLADKKGITGKVDYVVSSHNFEHTPDPIRFLQDCARVLKPGGILSLAVPDKRRCFDYFRPHSTVGEFLDAYYGKRLSPSAGQIFDHFSLIAVADQDGTDRIAWTEPMRRDKVRPQQALPDPAFAILDRDGNVAGGHYVDAHCWQFTPASLKFNLGEIARLGLLPMSVDMVEGPNLHEIYARLSNAPPKALDSVADRLALLREIDKQQRDGEDPNDALLRELKLLERELTAERHAAARLNRELAAERDAAARLTQELGALRNSSSWKVTAPMRAVKRVVDRAKR